LDAPDITAPADSSDEFTVPLCRGHHRELHRFGDEAAWWGRQGIDPMQAARALWLERHPLQKTEDDVTTIARHPSDPRPPSPELRNEPN
jgi:hypothetical protein